MIAPDAVVTFEHVDGFRIVKSFGYAYGHAQRPRNILRATFRSIGAFIGLAPIEYLTDAERARTESLSALLEKAEAMGATRPHRQAKSTDAAKAATARERCATAPTAPLSSSSCRPAPRC